MILGRTAAVAAVVVFLAAAMFVASRAQDAIDTDILSLLPDDKQDAVLAAALRSANENASSRVAFVVEGGTAGQRRTAAGALDDALTATGFFHSSLLDGEAQWRWLFSNRTTMLCPADRARLESDRGREIALEALRQWYAPMGAVSSRLLDTDPLLLTQRLTSCLAPAAAGAASNPSIEVISGAIDASVFRLDVQDRLNLVIDDWRNDWASQGLSLHRAGAVFHAAYGAQQARNQIGLIGGLTLSIILLIYWLMFRSFSAPIIALGMIGYSLTIGVAVTLFVFGHIHVMALVFGAALIGMVIDYTSYYLVTGLDEKSRTRDERRTYIIKPLSLGMLTSVGSFLVLLIFPVPAFQQIAVLGGAGLVAAWIATIFLTPLVAGQKTRVGPAALWIRKLVGRYLSRRPPGWVGALAIAAIGLVGTAFAIGAIQVSTLDDVRKFQSPSPVLTAEEARVRELIGFTGTGSFYLVRGATLEEVTTREETLLKRLDDDGEGHSVVWAASRVDSSAGRKSADRDLIRTRLIEPHFVLLRPLGADKEKAYGAPVTPTTSPPQIAASLRGETDGIYWSIVPVTAAPQTSFEFPPGSMHVDPAQRYTGLMESYRRLATWGLAGAALSTAIVLLLVYRRFSALNLMLPTVAAVLLTPLIAGALGFPFSFFSAMGLFLVAGAGMDYAIFQWEHPGEQGGWTQVGIALAALVTCISVGLLALSSVLPVRALGITVAVGVFLSLALSPLVRSRWGGSAFSRGK